MHDGLTEPSVCPKGDRMDLTRALRATLLVAGVAAAALVLGGCAAKTGTRTSGAMEDVGDVAVGAAAKETVEVDVKDAEDVVVDPGVVLEYRMSAGGSVSYTFKSESTQTMQIKGQSIPVKSMETLSFSVRPNGMKDGIQVLGITIDGVSATASSPSGTMDADAEELVGKSFDMTLSKLGIEGGLPDPGDLTYVMGEEGPKSIIPGFGVMFPDLPGTPVRVGDTWPARLEMTEGDGESSVVIAIDAVNTLEGLDTLDGFECARITTVLKGTIKGNGKQQGTVWTMDSVMDGTGTWYFAYEEGILISDWTEGTADGAITIDAPDGEMVMPVVRELNMVTELVR